MKKFKIFVILSLFVSPSLAMVQTPEIHKVFKTIPELAPINRILVLKSQRILMACSEKGCSEPIPITTGAGGSGTKISYNDYKTPEGTYYIRRHEENFKYYGNRFTPEGIPELVDGGINLLLSYPNYEDYNIAVEYGFPVPQTSLIRIHAGNTDNDGFASRGCIRVPQNEMELLYDYTIDNAEVIIYR